MFQNINCNHDVIEVTVNRKFYNDTWALVTVVTSQISLSKYFIYTRNIVTISMYICLARDGNDEETNNENIHTDIKIKITIFIKLYS